MIKGVAKTYIPEDWKITENRYVGFIDIMGFKDMVIKKPSGEIYDMMNRLHKVIKNTTAGFGEDHDVESDSQVLDNLIVTIITFSDSILVFSKDESELCYDSFVLTVSSLCEELFLQKIPHRGVVAKGEMTLDFKKSIYFGQPLIDAYTMEQDLAFYGVVCHGTFESSINNFPVNEYHNLHLYDCPFKTGNINHYLIFPMSVKSNNDADFLATRKNVYGFRIDTSGTIRKYIDNTLKYLDFVRKEAKP